MDILPNTEYTDPRRLPLLQRLETSLNLGLITVDAWALLWGCDIDKLEGIVSDIEQQAPGHQLLILSLLLLTTGSRLYEALTKPLLLKDSFFLTSNAWTGYTSSDDTLTDDTLTDDTSTDDTSTDDTSTDDTSTDDTSTVDTQSLTPSIVQKAFERDGGCVLSKVYSSEIVEVAHICPVSMAKTPPCLTSKGLWIWGLFRMFYSDADTAAWEEILFHEAETEKMENLLTMTPTTVHAWKTCQFALLPISISPDATSMQVRFFWLKIRPRGNGYIRLTTVPDLPSDTPSGLGGLLIFNCATHQRIESGDVITLTNHDPINFPFPSEALLRMQWHLNRIGALAGSVQQRSEKIWR